MKRYALLIVVFVLAGSAKGVLMQEEYAVTPLVAIELRYGSLVSTLMGLPPGSPSKLIRSHIMNPQSDTLWQPSLDPSRPPVGTVCHRLHGLLEGTICPICGQYCVPDTLPAQ